MGSSKHAVVIGGSIAGMCAARALRSRFDKVTIMEQDSLAQPEKIRRGTPQAWHNHFLLGAGQEAIETLFPGFVDRLIAHGGVAVDPGYDTATCLSSGWMPRARTNTVSLFASRPRIEETIREFVRGDPGIVFRENVRATGLLSVGQGPETVVTGVEYHDSAGLSHREVGADLVVDAAGRGSRATRWMRKLGLEIDELTLDAKMNYSSRLYRLPDEPVAWWKTMAVFPDSDPRAPESHQYVCMIFPIEDNRMIAMMGSWGSDLPSDAESFERLARGTRSKEFARVLDASEPLTDVHHTRSTRNIWHRFDRLPTPPQGFVAVGDAVCAFNPIYGQGMSAAAVAGLLVQQVADRMDPCSAGFPAAFYAEHARFLQRPWVLAMARDRGFAHAQGTEAIVGGPHMTLLRRVNWPAFQFFAEAVWQDTVIDAHFGRVFNVQESLSEFLTNPRVLAGLGRYGVKKLLKRTGVPATVPPYLPPPDTDYSAVRGPSAVPPVGVR